MAVAEAQAHTSYHEIPAKTVFAIMSGVLVTMLMSALDSTIVSTAMPRIISELHGFQHYAGVITAYMVASTATIPVVGKLSDFYGRRLFLLSGVALFVSASMLCGLSESMAQLICFRGLQGIGAGTCQAMAFTTIADLFPPAKRGRVTGYMGGVFGLSSVIGPALGGFLTDGPGWRYVFYVNLPVGAVAFGTLYMFFPKIISGKARPRIDYWGSITLVLSVIPLLLALSWGGHDYPWSSAPILGLFLVGAISLMFFALVERRAPEPILPFHLFKFQIIWSAMLVSALVAMSMFGTTLFIPLFIQSVIGTSATRSGAVMMPMTTALVISAIISGQLINCWGRYQVFAIGGVALTGLGMFLLSVMTADTSYAVVIRNMVIMGVGLGSTMPVFTLAVQNAVEVHWVGTATSTVQFIRSMGGALGAAIFGTVLAARAHALGVAEEALHMVGGGPKIPLEAREGLAMALHDVFLMGAILLVIATAFAFLVKDIPLRKTNRPGAELADAG